MIDYAPTNRVSANVWKKYRPAVLKLMVDAANGPQHYKFSPHEFRINGTKEKGGHSFTLKVSFGKSVDNLKGLQGAKDLLEVLKQSNKAMELTEAASYEFVLDKAYMFHVTKIEKAVDVPPPGTENPEVLEG